MKLTKSLVVGAALTLLPTIALAQDAAAVSEEMVWIMNTLLFLIGGFLVFFMAAGFALLLPVDVLCGDSVHRIWCAG